MFEELNQHRAAVAEQIQKATEIGFTAVCLIIVITKMRITSGTKPTRTTTSRTVTRWSVKQNINGSQGTHTRA